MSGTCPRNARYAASPRTPGRMPANSSRSRSHTGCPSRCIDMPWTPPTGRWMTSKRAVSTVPPSSSPESHNGCRSDLAAPTRRIIESLRVGLPRVLLRERRVLRGDVDDYPLIGDRNTADLQPCGQLRHLDGVIRERTEARGGDAVETLHSDHDPARSGLHYLCRSGERADAHFHAVRSACRVRCDRDALRAGRGCQRVERDQRGAGYLVDGRAVEAGVEVHAGRPGLDARDVQLARLDIARAQVDRPDVVRGELGQEREAL